MKKRMNSFQVIGITSLLIVTSCGQNKTTTPSITEASTEIEKPSVDPEPEIDLTNKKPISEPLVSHIYTADPSAHVFNDKLYIYPSHDIITDTPMDDEGNHFDMKDYHVLSMDSVGGKVTDHGVGLDIKDVKWAGKQMWAPDAAEKEGIYYLYFPVKDKKGDFGIGVASSKNPAGPFKAEDKPIEGAYSMDPSVFEENGNYYMYLGGIWGGQLQNWQTGTYDANGVEPEDDKPAISPVIAKLNPDMISLAETPKKIQILDKDGSPILAGDHDRRFFEASWVHKYNDKYYFSYSRWTNHHSIAKFKGTWYLFYHDSKLSGKTHLRTVKMTPLTHNADGTIATITAYK